MLHEEVARYRELSGDTNPDTPISRIGGYLDGYEKALEQEPCDAVDREAVLDLCDSKDPDYKVIHFKEDIECLPPVTLRLLNPEADREESKAYCAECDHIEMCSWYPHDGCEWLKTDRYNAGYNAAKREIALSGEYERAYERGKADAQPKTGHWIFDEILDKHYYCSECKSMGVDYWDFCPNCGAKMVDPQKGANE